MSLFMLDRSPTGTLGPLCDVASVQDAATLSISSLSRGFVAQHAVERRCWAYHDFAQTARTTFYGGASFRLLLATGFSFLNRLTFKMAACGAFWRVYMNQSCSRRAACRFIWGV